MNAPLNILIIEDDKPQLNLVKMIAQRVRPEKEQFVCISDYEKAIKEIENNKFDIIISDLGLPGSPDFKTTLLGIQKASGPAINVFCSVMDIEDELKELIDSTSFFLPKDEDFYEDLPELLGQIISTLEI